MSRRTGGVTYGFILVGVALLLVVLVAWLVDPGFMPPLVREHVCEAP